MPPPPGGIDLGLKPAFIGRLMINKRIPTPAEAVAGVKDGDMVLISGFGEAGNPTELIHALIDLGTKDLTVVNNSAGNGAQYRKE